MSAKHIAESGQSIFDVALQQYGSLDGIAFLIEDNNWSDGFEHQLQAGEEVVLRDLDSLDDTSRSIVAALAKVDRVFNTGVPIAPSSDNCWVEDGWVEDGWVACETSEEEIDIVNYYLELLDELGILNDIVAGRNVSITAELDPGETTFSIFATVDHEGTYTAVNGYNVDSYIINVNENPQTLPFEIESGDELEIIIVPTDELDESEISITGTY